MPAPSPISEQRFRSCRLLLTKKARAATGTCMIEGRRFVEEALDSGAGVLDLLVTARFAGTAEGRDLMLRADARGVGIWSITERQLDRLSETVTAQGVIAVIRRPGVDPGVIPGLTGEGRLVVALDGVADPGNIGTIIRSCAWFGADGILLSDGSAELSNPKLLRSTMGAVFRIPVAADVSLESVLPGFRAKGFRILAAEAGGAPAGTVIGAGGPMVLVFGSEAHGISPAVRATADATFGIPGSGRVESLNVSVAVGISLHIAAAR